MLLIAFMIIWLYLVAYFMSPYVTKLHEESEKIQSRLDIIGFRVDELRKQIDSIHESL